MQPIPSHASGRSAGQVLPGLAVLGVLLLAPHLAQAAPAVYAQSAMVKVRPEDPPQPGTPVALVAARNEFVSFQVVVHGADSGATQVRASLEGLTGPSSIPSSHITLYREGYLLLTRPSGGKGQLGVWPDPLIPDRDEIAGEQRQAFPFDVPRGQSRALWVDILVPQEARAGRYQGRVRVSGSGLSAEVPVTLTVVEATLPSTASLSSAFLIGGNNVCRAHTGDSECRGDYALMAELLARYQRMALEHRVTLPNIFLTTNTQDWSKFDQAYAPFLEGTAPTRLPGARMTSAQFPGPLTPERLASFTQHFRERGWLDRAYVYVADEPPHGASFEETLRRAQQVRQAAPEVPTLVTTHIEAARQHGLEGLLDVLCPVVNFMDGTAPDFRGEQRPRYDEWLKGPRRRLWFYQSCMSQGCGYGTNAPENQGDTGWPSYMVDRSAAKNRAMQWVAFLQRVQGELYYETALKLPEAWSDLFDFNGNGDGTLFYPGTPAAVGGASPVPVASIRLKQIRQGMQDYEWLKLVSEAGDPAMAHQVARSLIPSAWRVGDEGESFDKARLQLIQRYLELRGKPSAALSPVDGQAASGGAGDPGQPGLTGCGASTTGLPATSLLLVGVALVPWLRSRARRA
jgi:hypothetical protein